MTMNDTLKALKALVITTAFLLPLIAMAQTADFIQASSPVGIVDVSNSIAIPAQVMTVTAPLASDSQRFTHWTIDGSRPADGPLGRAANPVTYTMTQASTSTAHYLPESQDADRDSVADWFEVLMAGSTSITATANADGDALSFRQEYERDTHPQIADTFQDGGMSWGDTTTVILTDPDFARYIENSIPAGLHDLSTIVPVGTTRQLPDMTGTDPDFVFAEWRVNGTRVEDSFGRSIGGMTVVVTNDTLATALFVPLTADTYGNGVPDWFEWNYIGEPVSSPPQDQDSDGLTLRDEFIRDTHPNLKDTVLPGGVSWRDTEEISISFDGIARYSFTSDPPGWVNESGHAPTGTVVSTPFLVGEVDAYTFAQWTLNGVRQTNTYGIPLNQLHIALTNDMLAVATYRPTDLDTNEDGVPDWAEFAAFGTVTNAANNDTDGDGLTFLEEFNRHTNPHLTDDIQAGGVSWQDNTASLDLRLLGPDTDGDDLPDWWEILYFQTLARTGSNNFDGDVFSDMQEWIAWSNPTNTSDVLTINSIQMGSEGTILTWPTGPGRLYVLETKTNIFSASWETVYTTWGNGGLHRFTNGYPEPIRFFRLSVSLP